MKTTITVGALRFKETKSPTVYGLNKEELATLQQDHYELEWDGGTVEIEHTAEETAMIIDKSLKVIERNKEVFMEVFKSPVKKLVEMWITHLKKESDKNGNTDKELKDGADKERVSETVS